MNFSDFKTTKKNILHPKLSKFEKLEPKNCKNLHFHALKVTKIKNYMNSEVHSLMNLVAVVLNSQSYTCG